MKLRLSYTVLVILLGCTVLPSLSQDENQQAAIREAADFYISKIRSDPENLALHRELVDKFSKRDMAFIPITIYSDSLEKFPANATVTYVLGYAHLAEGSPESLEMAGKNLKAALEERPLFPDALGALGDYYMKLERPDLALEKWKEAIGIDNGFEPAHLSLARFYRSQQKYEKAIEEYQKSISYSPKSFMGRSFSSVLAAERYLELGLTYFDMRNLDGAEEAFLAAKGHDSGMAMAYYKLGQIHAKRGDRDKAIKMYRDGREHDPDNAEVAYELAHIFLDMGDTRYALLSMERGLSADAVDTMLAKELLAEVEKGPADAAEFMTQLANFEYSDNFYLHHFLGKLYLKLGNNERALKHLKSAVELSPPNADAHYQLGLLQEELEPEKAREQYQKAAELGAPEADVIFKAAQGYLEEGLEGKFIEMAQRALAIDPKRADVHVQLADVFRKRADIYRNNGQKKQEDAALEEAVKHSEQAAELQPDAQKWYDLGLLYERQGKIKAVRAYDKATQLDPNFARAYYRRGDFRLNYKVGRAEVLLFQPEVAVEDLKKAIELDPSLAAAHFSLGRAYHQMGKQELATAEFAEAAKVDPDNAQAHIYLAQDYAALGENQKVIGHLSKAAKLDSENVEVLKTLGAMQLKFGGDGGVQPAMEALEKAVKLRPDDAEILSNYAYTLYLNRMFNDAIDNYRKALEIWPDYPEANYNVALVYSRVQKYQLARQHWEKVMELVPDSDLASKAAEYVEKMKKSEEG